MTSARRTARRTARPATPGPPTRARGAGRAVGALRSALGVLLVLGVLAGCALRLETPDPPAPVPDAVETARQRAATDAADLSSLARAVAATDATLAEQLESVARASDDHLAALGGVYVPYPEASPEAGRDATAAPDGGATTTPSATAPATPVAADVVALLVEAASTARTDADAVPDAALARLLASVSASRTLHAETLAGATGASLQPAPFEVPGSAPAGLVVTEIATVVQAEDALGSAGEVVAARASDPDRAAAAARAAEHRAAGGAWAVAGQVAGTGVDPRRVAYDLPAVVLDPAADPAAVAAALADLEARLADSYASLVAAADPGARVSLVDGLLTASRSA
ncbi:MAG TPA: DUF4439 domain-containing protein, partial [Actinotalea sp.]|nr:DUF4439 domain-containing protein [Actinotalea sp.]